MFVCSLSNFQILFHVDLNCWLALQSTKVAIFIALWWMLFLFIYVVLIEVSIF